MKILSWKLVATLLLLGTPSIQAATVTWVGDRNNTGVNSMDWFDAGTGDTQWSGDVLPSTGDIAVMDETGTYPDTASGSANGSVNLSIGGPVTITKWEIDKIFQGIGLVAGSGGEPAHQANDITFTGSGPITFDGPGTVLEIVEWLPGYGAESIDINPQIVMPTAGIYKVLRRSASEQSNDILFLNGQFTGNGTLELDNETINVLQRIDINNSSSDYTGGTILSGYIGFTSGTAFSSGNVELGVNRDTVLESRGGAATVSNTIELNNTPGRDITINNRNGNTLALTGGISGGDVTSSLTLRVQNGSGVIEIGGTNTFVAPLTIVGPGDAVLTGSLSQSNITVSSGGTLLSDGGTMTLNIEDDTADQISVVSGGTLDLSNMNLVVDLTGTQTLAQYVFLSGDGSISAEFTNISVNSVSGEFEASVLDLGSGTFAVQLSEIIAPIPEPSSLVLLSLGALLVARRRKKQS